MQTEFDLIVAENSGPSISRYLASDLGDTAILSETSSPLSWKAGNAGRAAVLVWHIPSDAADAEGVIAQFLRRYPQAIIIAVVGAGWARKIVSLVRAGAHDVLIEPYDMAALSTSICSSVEGMVLEAPGGHQEFQQKWQSLSAREQEVLRLVVEGKVTKQIAFQLGLSTKTIDLYRTNIKRKFGNDSVASLVNMAVTHGIQASGAPMERRAGAR